MRPDGHVELEDLLSGDPGRILDAIGEVMTSRDTQTLGVVSGALDRIRAATASVDLGGRILLNQRHLDLLFERLELYLQEQKAGFSRDVCFCRLIPKMTATSATTLSLQKRVEIVKSKVLRDHNATLYRIECTACGAQFRGREETGWHMATYDWSEIPDAG